MMAFANLDELRRFFAAVVHDINSTQPETRTDSSESIKSRGKRIHGRQYRGEPCFFLMEVIWAGFRQIHRISQRLKT